MADKRLTITLFLESLCAPRVREKVVTTGKASGITPTAKAIENIASSGIEI